MDNGEPGVFGPVVRLHVEEDTERETVPALLPDNVKEVKMKPKPVLQNHAHLYFELETNGVHGPNGITALYPVVADLKLDTASVSVRTVPWHSTALRKISKFALAITGHAMLLESGEPGEDGARAQLPAGLVLLSDREHVTENHATDQLTNVDHVTLPHVRMTEYGHYGMSGQIAVEFAEKDSEAEADHASEVDVWELVQSNSSAMSKLVPPQMQTTGECGQRGLSAL